MKRSLGVRQVCVWLFVAVAAVALAPFSAIAAPGVLLGVLVAVILHFVNRDVVPARDDERGGWGPNMSRISFSGAGGLIFTIGSMAIFFIGVPPVRWFFAVSLPLGIAVGLILHFAHHD